MNQISLLNILAKAASTKADPKPALLASNDPDAAILAHYIELVYGQAQALRLYSSDERISNPLTPEQIECICLAEHDGTLEACYLKILEEETNTPFDKVVKAITKTANAVSASHTADALSAAANKIGQSLHDDLVPLINHPSVKEAIEKGEQELKLTKAKLQQAISSPLAKKIALIAAPIIGLAILSRVRRK